MDDKTALGGNNGISIDWDEVEPILSDMLESYGGRLPLDELNSGNLSDEI